MNIKQYLERIEYTNAISPTVEVLATLQQQHLLHVPFENLDIHNNTKIDLNNLFDKIVTRRRGGFCYELNGLFYQLLKEIGFAVIMVSARVYDGKNNFSPEFDHLALIVTINNEDYLTDAGFGEFSLHPIKIELGKEAIDPRGIFITATFDEHYIAVKKKNAEEQFITEYIFTRKERQMEEFYDRCNYHQTNSASHFMQKRICSLPTKTGRITLTGNRLKITDGGSITEQVLNNEQEVQQTLWHYFGIKL